jgi:hypothetical protein
VRSRDALRRPLQKLSRHNPMKHLLYLLDTHAGPPENVSNRRNSGAEYRCTGENPPSTTHFFEQATRLVV